MQSCHHWRSLVLHLRPFPFAANHKLIKNDFSMQIVWALSDFSVYFIVTVRSLAAPCYYAGTTGLCNIQQRVRGSSGNAPMWAHREIIAVTLKKGVRVLMGMAGGWVKAESFRDGFVYYVEVLVLCEKVVLSTGWSLPGVCRETVGCIQINLFPIIFPIKMFL